MLSSSIAEAESYSAVATKCTAVTPEPDDEHQRWRKSQTSKCFVWIACSKSDCVRLGLHHGCPSSMILFTFLLFTDDVVRQWPPVCSKVVCNGWNVNCSLKWTKLIIYQSIDILSLTYCHKLLVVTEIMSCWIPVRVVSNKHISWMASR